MGFMKSCSITDLSFNKCEEGEFTKTLWANIPGIPPEEVYFDKLNKEPFDETVQLRIECMHWDDNDHLKEYYGILPINLNEFYGFDYEVSDGVLKIILYREKKEDIQLFKHGFQLKSKYPKKPISYI